MNIFDRGGIVTQLIFGFWCRQINQNGGNGLKVLFPQDLINVVDKDGTGTIDFPEFLQMMRIKVLYPR